MPRTPPTICCPLPNDPRVFALAKASGLTTWEAFAAAAECWAWVAVQSVDDIVVNAGPDSLDAVVDVEGFGQSMLQAGLVGTVDGGLVLPAELRRRAGGQRGGERAAADKDDQDDRLERQRKGARIRQRRRRATKALTKFASKTTTVTPPAEPTDQKGRIRRLGDVEGFPVMLLWSRAGVPFYKLAGASPKEWTGTVTDPENPTFADALVALHAAMKREATRGLGDPTTMRPTPEAVLTAAERYRARLGAAAANDARRDEANRAAAEAAADDQGDADQEPAERDSHAHVTHGERDSVTVTEASRQKSVTCPPNSSSEPDFGCVDCHAPVTVSAPSSSSSSFSASGSSEQSSKENTTTTSGVTDAERDHEDRILDRILDRIAPRVDPEQAKQQDQKRQRQRALAEKFAAHLKEDADSILNRWKVNHHLLRLQLEALGIDPNTGEPVNADAPRKPSQARADIPVTTEPAASDTPAGGIVDARGGDEPDKVFEVTRDRLVEQLRGPFVAAAADTGGAGHGL